MTYIILMRSGTAWWEISVHTRANNSRTNRLFDAATITWYTKDETRYIFFLIGRCSSKLLESEASKNPRRRRNHNPPANLNPWFEYRLTDGCRVPYMGQKWGHRINIQTWYGVGGLRNNFCNLWKVMLFDKTSFNKVEFIFLNQIFIIVGQFFFAASLHLQFWCSVPLMQNYC